MNLEMLAPDRQAVNPQRKTVLSGVQPTGSLHIGNYVGALSQWVADQYRYNNLFFIANLHGLTIPEAVNPAQLREHSREVAALYIACGINPDVSTIFLQSDVPAHAYLTWILGCCTPVGWLERMTQYKTKAAKAETVSSGLLMYPVLQAADILIYRANYVPVGEDQSQHLEITRDIAARFNHLFGEYFPLPEALLRPHGARIMGLDDPTAKMSKSTAQTRAGHAVNLMDDADTIRRTVKHAVTDTGNEVRFDHASPGVKNLLVLYEALSGESRPAIESKFADTGYGFLKREVADIIITTLEPIQRKYHQIVAEAGYLDDVLAVGAGKASTLAERTVAEIRRLVGV